MRQAPYPATDDTLLMRMFGAEALAGRTLLCTAGGGTPRGDWVVAVVEGSDGIHALEHLSGPDGRASTSRHRLTSQAEWSALLERAFDPAITGTVYVSLIDWMQTEIILAQTIPDWDEVAAGMVLEDITARAKQFALDREASRPARRTDAMVEDLVRGLDPNAPPLDERAREILRAMVELSDARPSGMRLN